MVLGRHRGLDDEQRGARPHLAPRLCRHRLAGGPLHRRPTGGDAYGSIEAHLELFEQLPGPAVVVFQDVDDPPVSAVFGEVMCSTYKAYGSVGLVTNGGGRDLEQVRALDYPAFTGSTICSHGYCHMLHLALPVRVGGLMVNQGDLLHGDANGVTSIPPEIAAEVADIGDEFIAAEEIMLDYVKAPGEKDREEFSRLREQFSEVVEQLKSRVART